MGAAEVGALRKLVDPQRVFARIQAHHRLGPRFVGSPGHARLHGLLESWLSPADWLRQHTFEDTFFGARVTCRNFWAHFRGDRPGRILLGTHFDTRPWADRDPDPARRRDPVPGANDGGSATALLAELATYLSKERSRPAVDIVLFDAEDWHEIDGKEVSLGSRRFVADLADYDRPDCVLILDMIAGRDLCLDVDVNCQTHDQSYALTLDVFQLGRAAGLPAFGMNKPHPYKWIGCDHTAFMEAGIPSAILIDLDYPVWHTVEDTPTHCDPDSLRQMARLVETFLARAAAGDPA